MSKRQIDRVAEQIATNPSRRGRPSKTITALRASDDGVARVVRPETAADPDAGVAGGPLASESPVPLKVRLCGDYGGVRRRMRLPDGKIEEQLCTRDAGWATDHRGTGTCIDHTAERVAEMEIIKREFVERYADQPVTVWQVASAIKKELHIHCTVTTIGKIRNLDPDFDDAVQELKAAVDRVRLEIVEDSAFMRMADANKNADVFRIFWLSNRDPSRWRDRRNVAITGSGAGGAIPLQPVAPDVRQAVRIGDFDVVF